MKNFLLLISFIIILFSCREKTKVITTKFTDVGIKDTVIHALAVVDTITADSLKIQAVKNDTIVPGVSVGKIKIGETAEILIQIMGQPDSSNAAMSKAYNGWFTKPTMTGADTTSQSFETFSVVSGKNVKETASRVKRIRITSPQYRTDMKVGVGNTLAYVKLQYPNLKKPVAKSNLANGALVELYDETNEGIAFEIVDDKCVAIIIHEKGQKYLTTTF
jgi:hypothetical protein